MYNSVYHTLNTNKKNISGLPKELYFLNKDVKSWYKKNIKIEEKLSFRNFNVKSFSLKKHPVSLVYL